ncbi:MAG TPA: HisA/HisF-related TIM barrel protein [Woeseiaceae bacterium]|nr:HisA/HisF-related TIM barrel protein [Woeseiaceae bacterium]
MLLMPAIDLRGGRCVRLRRGDFDAETRYEVAPQELLERYRALGASWLHLVDLDGARAGTQPNRATILALAGQTGVKLQVGGGIRDATAVEAMLDAGVARVVIGSAAVRQPAEVRRWLRRFGAEAIVLAFDVRLARDGIPRCAIHGWRDDTGLPLWRAVGSYRAEGLRHVLCTDIARDGALSGPNLHLYKECARRYPQVRWQASGGVRDVADLRDLAAAGAAAAVSGRALLEKRLEAAELQPFLPDA